ncbi:MAG: hypothetical protein GY757_04085 [bacterium]|nr:hypothetical protein [bacterium]
MEILKYFPYSKNFFLLWTAMDKMERVDKGKEDSRGREIRESPGYRSNMRIAALSCEVLF